MSGTGTTDGRNPGSDETCLLLANNIKKELLALPIHSLEPCIYKIPKLIRQRNEQEYTPVQVSIGPLHHKDKSLDSMKDGKLSYLRSFLNDSQQDLASYIQLVKVEEARIRACYADPTSGFSSEGFTKMVLIDSVFIIELFRRVSSESLCKNDMIWRNPGLINGVLRDICLAENQLPLFIIQALYDFAFRQQHRNANVLIPLTFTDLACQFLGVIESRISVNDYGESGCCHLLDMLRTHYLPSDIRQLAPTQSRGRIFPPTGGLNMYQKNMVLPSATRLSEAGVKFKLRSQTRALTPTETGTESLTESTASQGVDYEDVSQFLSIPKLEARNLTESLLRNLVAFEQCHYHPHTFLTSYYFFMDCLINTAEDVRLLTKAGIIENSLGCEEDLANLFNSISKDIYLDPSCYYFAEISAQLIRDSNKKWNKHKAMLKHTYFRHPWAVISVIYAAILLVFTAVQVVTGILAVPGVRKSK